MLINSCPDLDDAYQEKHRDCDFDCLECYPDDDEFDCEFCGEWNRCTCFDDEDEDQVNRQSGTGEVEPA